MTLTEGHLFAFIQVKQRLIIQITIVRSAFLNLHFTKPYGKDRSNNIEEEHQRRAGDWEIEHSQMRRHWVFQKKKKAQR